MPTIYDVIDVLPFNGHNWFSNAQHLSALFQKFSIKTIIEVGSWLGGSTRWFAKQLPEDGYIVAVDTWQGTVKEVERGELTDHNLDVLYQQFLSNTMHEHLSGKIIPVRMASLEAAHAIKIIPDLFFLDAAHDFDNIYKDLQAWVPKIRNHSIICGDDWACPDVQRAVNLFATENNLEVIGIENFWMYKK